MKRLTREQYGRIVLLHKKGWSLRRISSEMGLAKGTVYYHVRKKFGRRYLQVILDYRPTDELGEFLGLFVTDGCFYIDKKRYHYTLTISLSKYQFQYARIVQGFVERIIGKRPRIDVKTNIVQLVVRGKTILPFLKHFLIWKGRRTYTIRFRETALLMNEDFLKGIIRGMISGDGGVYPLKHRISFGVVSKLLARQFSSLLTKFGIPYKAYFVRYEGKRTFYHIHINGRENLEKFKLRVGLTDPAKKRRLALALRR